MDDIITIPMTQEQFERAQAALGDSADQISGTHAGTVHSKQLDFDYTYDGTTLMLTILARHGLKAKMASDEQIKDHIEKLLA